MTRRLVALAFVPLALVACGGKSTSKTASTIVATTTPTTPAAGDCRSAVQPKARQSGTGKAPAASLGAAQKIDAVVNTNCGSFTIRLAQGIAPHATASFVALAKAGFFDNTTFHRIVPGFVIQGGDPTATGGGGPGYSTVDPPPASTRYTKGVVAMAKTQAEAPGTAGSQFFVVTAPRVELPPDYAVIGNVVKGIAVVERIGNLGDPATEQPTQPVVVARVTIKVR